LDAWTWILDLQNKFDRLRIQGFSLDFWLLWFLKDLRSKRVFSSDLDWFFFGFSFIHWTVLSSDIGLGIAYHIRLNDTNIQLEINQYKREIAIFLTC